MTDKLSTILPITLAHEGGWSDHPEDPGGATMKGVTQRTYNAWRSRQGATLRSVRRITEAELRSIYREDYWRPVRGDDLPPGLDLVAFDAAVNSGVSRGSKWLQQAIGVSADGRIGEHTLAMARNQPVAPVIKAACALRMGFLRGLKIWSTFGRGWSRRVADIEARALAMVQPAAAMRKDAAAARTGAASRTTGAVTAAGGGGGALSLADLPQWAAIGAGAVIILLAILLIGQARHDRTRAAAMAAAIDGAPA